MDAHAVAQPRWRISLGEDVRVADRFGVDATPRLRKMRAIIAILASTPDHNVARRELIKLLWSGRGAEQARASLRQSLFMLRSEAPALVEADGERVWLVRGNIDIVFADNSPPRLSELADMDFAFDRWLEERGRVDRVTPAVAANTALVAASRWHPKSMTSVLGALLIAAIFTLMPHDRGPPPTPALPVIAVLPFAAVPDTPAASAVARPMSDDIRALLPADRAVVRASGVAGDRARQAKLLNAEWIITGSVTVRGDAGKVHVQVETPDGRPIWGRDVDAAPGHLADAAAIATTRMASATGCALGGPRVHRDVDVLALLFAACERMDYDADGYDHVTSLATLRRLADRAPGDALAQAYFGAGLAVTADDMPPGIARSQRAEAVVRLDRAAHLDPRVGEIWLGRFALVGGGHAYALRESLLARGLSVEPTNPTLNLFMGELLAGVGRGDEGLVYEKRALALAPAFLAPSQLAAGMLSAADSPREAFTLLDAGDRRFPDNYRQAWQRLDALLTSGDTAGARALLDRAAAIRGWLEPEREAAKRRLTYAIDDPHGTLADAVVRDAIDDADADPRVAGRSFNILTQLGRTDAALALALRHPLDPSVYFRLQARPVLLNRAFPVLARREGLWDYWQSTGRWPDVCHDPQLRWRCSTGVKSASNIG